MEYICKMNEKMENNTCSTYNNGKFRTKNIKSEQEMNEEVFKKWDQLFGTYFENLSFPDEWYIGVQRLFADEVFEEEMSAAMEKYFNRMVQYDSDPDDEVIANLEKIKTELGF